MKTLILEELREALHYFPETGVFTWVKPTGRRVKAGDIAGNPHSNGYLRINVHGRSYLAHRLAWFYMTGKWPAEQVDHRNQKRADNSWLNLRLASDCQNKANQGINAKNTSGVKGVYWDKRRRKWHAGIQHQKRTKFVGYFDDLEAATKAMEVARKATHGEFANSGASAHI